MNREHSPETRERALRMLAEARLSDPAGVYMEGGSSKMDLWSMAARDSLQVVVRVASLT
jgi:hypothetical protein